jgi:hypothetical protein
LPEFVPTPYIGSLMPWSRRRKWFVLILGLAVIAAIWLWPVSPLRNAYNQIRVDMNAVQVAEVLERCGWSKYRAPGRFTGRGDPVVHAYLSLHYFSGAGIETESDYYKDTLIYRGADGETLTIRWDLLIIGGHVLGKEYDSGIWVKLRGLCDRLRRMLHW